MRNLLSTLVLTLFFIPRVYSQVTTSVFIEFLPPLEEISFNGLGTAFGENGGSIEFHPGDKLGIETAFYGISIPDFEDESEVSGFGWRAIGKYYLNPSSRGNDRLNLQVYYENYIALQTPNSNPNLNRDVRDFILGLGVGYKALSNFRFFLEGSVGYGFSIKREDISDTVDNTSVELKEFEGFYSGYLYAKLSLGIRIRGGAGGTRGGGRSRGNSFSTGGGGWQRLKVR